MKRNLTVLYHTVVAKLAKGMQQWYKFTGNVLMCERA